MKISDRILRLRRNHNLTLRDVADRLGVTTGAVSHWESGRRKPGGPALLLLQCLFREHGEDNGEESGSKKSSGQAGAVGRKAAAAKVSSCKKPSAKKGRR